MFSGANDTAARANLVVRASIDQGSTWSSGEQVAVVTVTHVCLLMIFKLYAGPAGYSEMAYMRDGLIGILFENGDVVLSMKLCSFTIIMCRRRLPTAYPSVC